jgi:hypothetical protein
VSKDGPDSRKSLLNLPARRRFCPQEQEDRKDVLKKNLTEVWEKEIWPPSSPDCNPLDYFARGVFELRAKAKSRNETKDLIPKIREVMVSLARNTVAKACKRFRFIEKPDSQYVPLPTCFYFNKMGWFSAMLCHLKQHIKNSGFIPATLYFVLIIDLVVDYL